MILRCLFKWYQQQLFVGYRKRYLRSDHFICFLWMWSLEYYLRLLENFLFYWKSEKVIKKGEYEVKLTETVWSTIKLSHFLRKAEQKYFWGIFPRTRLIFIGLSKSFSNSLRRVKSYRYNESSVVLKFLASFWNKGTLWPHRWNHFQTYLSNKFGFSTSFSSLHDNRTHEFLNP